MITNQLLLNSFWTVIRAFPLPWIFIAVIIVVVLIISFIKLIRLAKSGMSDIDKMTGEDFEKYLEVLFRSDGYNVTHVGSASKYQGDSGADLIIEKNGNKTAVQAKRWN